ncbi:MAG: ABC transporter substrate-binding protein, partial [Acidimicrobiales bacterium]
RGRQLAMVGALCATAAITAFSAVPSSGAAVRAPRTTGVSAHQIVLGTTTPLTGPAAPGYDEIAPATNAVFKFVNSQGGVYGRKIKYIIEDDGYDPTITVQKTRELVQSDHIFADVGPLGTPTQLAVQGYLNGLHIPQVFIESGCACWNAKKYPYSFGWQPNYIVEGKILGQFVAHHYPRAKIGYLYQDDEFGQDGVKGLDQEIRHQNVVSRQTYAGTSQGLAAGLGNQIGAIKAAHAAVVVLYTIPAATTLALLAAAELSYHPQWIVSSVGADPPTLKGLLSSFSKGKAGGALLNGMISNDYLPAETRNSNPWNRLGKAILHRYDRGARWDGNSEYGIGLGICAVEALQDAGRHLTRGSFVKALETQGRHFANPGLVPLTYSRTDHYGFSGSEILRTTNNGNTIDAITPVYVTSSSGRIGIYKGGTDKIPALFAKALR